MAGHPRHARGLERNVKGEEDALLVLVATITCLVPDIAHPLIYPHGDHGAGKTYLHRVIRRVVDPSHTEVLSFPHDRQEFAQKLAHNYFAPFDNVGTLSDEQSDILCRAVTGEGFAKRMLYTDDDDVIYAFRRCVGLNGINVVSQRADLADRTLLVELERISPEQRREEAEFWADFNDSLPSILGGVLDALSGAMRIYPTVLLDRLPRLADFARWGEAIAQAVGFPGGAFVSAYGHNMQGQNRQVVEGSAVATAVMAFMDGLDEWEGTVGELLGELEKLVESLRIDIRAKSWPKAANALSRQLRALRSTLRDAGVEVTIGKHTRKGTPVILKGLGNIVTGVTSSLGYSQEPLRRGRGLLINNGSFYDWLGDPVPVCPDWGTGYDVLPDDQAGRVERLKKERLRAPRSPVQVAQQPDPGASGREAWTPCHGAAGALGRGHGRPPGATSGRGALVLAGGTRCGDGAGGGGRGIWRGPSPAPGARSPRQDPPGPGRASPPAGLRGR